MTTTTTNTTIQRRNRSPEKAAVEGRYEDAVALINSAASLHTEALTLYDLETSPEADTVLLTAAAKVEQVVPGSTRALGKCASYLFLQYYSIYIFI